MTCMVLEPQAHRSPRTRAGPRRYIGAPQARDAVRAQPESRGDHSRLVDGIQRLVPAYDGGDDLVGVCGPGEGLGVMVGLGEIAVDGGLEVDDRAEDAAFQAPLGEGGEEGLDRVEPRAGGGREVEGEAGMAGEPGEHLRLLVGGVVVEDDVDDLAGWDLCLDGVEEANELLVPVALHAAADDGAVEDVEG